MLLRAGKKLVHTQGIIQHFFDCEHSAFSAMLQDDLSPFPIFFSIPFILAIAAAVKPATSNVASINFFILFSLERKGTSFFSFNADLLDKR